MSQHAFKPRDYLESQPPRRLTDWAITAQVPALDAHRICSPASVLIPHKRPSLDELLQIVLSDEYGARLTMMREGAEFRVFSSDEVLLQLAAVLKEHPDATARVERALDEAFANFEVGERFDQTNQVAAVLYALGVSRSVGFEDILNVFAASPRAEFAQLRRFAVRLLQHLNVV